MKPQTFYSLVRGLGEEHPVATPGYPLTLPNLEGVEFTIVRPISWSEQTLPDRWQVIHVRSGLRVMYGLGHAATRVKARESAMAELERIGSAKGWPAVLRKLKRARNEAIMEALGHG
jgi:hypothetical protein